MLSGLEPNVIFTALINLMSDQKAYAIKEIETGVADQIHVDEQSRTSPHSGSITKLGYELAGTRTRARRKGPWSVWSYTLAKDSSSK